MSQRQRLFGEWLIALDCLSEKNLALALEVQDTSRQTPDTPVPYLGEILIEQGKITASVRDNVLELQKLLSTSTRLTDWQVPPEVLKKISPKLAQSHDVFPLLEIKNTLLVACAQCDDEGLKYELETATNQSVYFISWRARDIQEAVIKAYKHQEEAFGMDWVQDEYAPERGPFLTFVGTGDAVCTGARNQTCLHVRSEDGHFLIDCGPTSLMALKQLRLSVERLQGVLLTHGHGDHFGGVTFLLLEHMLTGRKQPFWLMGPQAVLDKVLAACDLFYPNLRQKLGFELKLLPISDQPRSVPGTGIMVFPFAMKHQKEALCLGYQVHLPEEKIIAYTGDTAWNSNLELLARDTDVFVTECSLYEPESDVAHLSYTEIKAHRQALKTRQIILTHMGEDVLKADLDIEKAYDGLTLDLSI